MKPATASEAIEIAIDALPGLDAPARRELLDAVLERERPDALVPTLGGQTALNLAVELEEEGITVLGQVADGVGVDALLEQLVERIQARVDPGRPLREMPKRQRRALAKPMADYAAR